MQQVISSKGFRRMKKRPPGTLKSFKQAKTPVKQSSEIFIEINKSEVERILRDIHKTPKKSPNPSETSSLEKKRRKTPLENLQSNLSPKYIGLSSSDGKRSRYGRQQRYKEPEDFLPTNIACYVRRTPSKLKIITSPGRAFEQKFVSYESPIEKLINKNKFLANMATAPQTESSKDVKELNISDMENTDLETNLGGLGKPELETQQENDVVKVAFTAEGAQTSSALLSPEVSLIKLNYPEKLNNSKKSNSPKLKKKQFALKSPNSSVIATTTKKSENKNDSEKLSGISSNLEVEDKANTPVSDFNKKSPKYETTSEINVEHSDSVKKQTESSVELDLVRSETEKANKITSNLNLVKNKPEANVNETKELVNTNLREMNKSPSANSTDSAKGSSIDLDFELPVVTGAIFWGRISTFPYWPCIVWPDPHGRTVSIIGRNQVKIHVRFFADNGRRSWVRKTDMLPFNGREDFDRRTKEVVTKYNKKHPNYRAFIVTDRKRKLWERAILEAELVSTEPLEKRSLKFNSILEETRKHHLEEKIKRRQSLNESRTSGKYSGMSEDALSIFSETGEYSYNTKRERSPTPESPAYEDIDDLKMFVKRRKLELNGEQIASNSKSMYEELNSMDFLESDNMFEDDEFKRFYDLMKSYAMVFNNEAMEKELYEHVKQIWIIRNAARRELKDTSFSSIFSSNEMNIRRLSSRMRTLSKKDNFFLNSESSTSLSRDRKEKQKRASKPVEEVVEDIMELNKNYLFKGLNREPVCKVCYKPSNLLKCGGSCQSWLHLTCVYAEKTSLPKQPQMVHVTGDSEEHLKAVSEIAPITGEVLCKQCKFGEKQECFVCKKNDPSLGERFKCHLNWCSKYFHLGCLKYWPQAKLTKSAAKIESLLCPGHVCHTCVSDDPRGKFLQIDKFKLAKCVECPATYHMDSFCIPAGTQFLTATNLICPRHRKGDDKKLQNINANWCFICATGGSLICCETCPTSFHLECLKISQPEGSYICEECETGRLPLYGEMVWAKLGTYRWWPAIIIPPPEVPKNLMRKAHNASDFCVRFFGSNDHTWISRNRVFLYQEGDWGRVNQTKGIDQTYKNGLEEARRTFELIKSKKLSQDNDKRDKRLTPPPYVKIKANRPVPPVRLQEVDVSELTACDCNPSDINPCGPNSGCLNRLLLTECNPKICPAGEKCQNQMFEKRLYPPLKVCRTNGKGWGLICEEDVMAGDFIIEYVGEIIDDAEFKRRIAQKQEEKDENYYFLTLEKDHMIDAGPKGNLARFMNHSCEPNCETQKWNINGVTRVGLFAIKDIPANTELTFNYNLECIGDDKKVCHCGAEKCAGFIGAKYKEPEKIKPAIPVIKKSKLKSATKKSVKQFKEKLPTTNNN